jgi:quercetin dioxygenase-like cupin family protein
MCASALLPANEAASLSLGDAAPAIGHGIVSRSVLTTPELRVTLFNFAAGQALTEHTSTSRALVHVLGGTCEFSIAGVPRTLRTGDVLHLPPNVPHALTATAPLTMLLTLGPVRTAT